MTIIPSKVCEMASVPGISAFPVGDNLFHWLGTVEGPKDTPYEGRTYKIHLKFPHDYPFSAPSVSFDTPIFHPNVDMNGAICLDILKDKWSAVYNVQTILLSLQSLLGGRDCPPHFHYCVHYLIHSRTK